MKKLLLLSSVFMLTLFLASCGGSEDKKDGSSEDKKGVVDPVTDTDGDGINDFKADGTTLDRCQPSEDTTFRSTATNDRDRDGCEDAGEDKDDDNDGINDVDINGNELDKCPFEKPTTDDNGDGCEDPDSDGDNVTDDIDVDDDNNGLIELTATTLTNIRYQLDGTTYKINASDTGSTAGCPTTNPVGCNGYEITNDIDLVGNFEPVVGDFTAIFDGNNNTINNLTISDNSTYTGFFKVLGASSEVRNLSFAGGSLTSTYAGTEINYVGVLAGESKGTISNVSSAVSVTVSNDHHQGYVGGLVGNVESGTIENSHATGDVSSVGGDDKVGGLVGSNGGTVRGSSATGNVDGGAGTDSVGGLVGESEGIIENSFATTGTVSGGIGVDYVGGLLGAFYSDGTIRNSFATGSVNGNAGDDEVGGLLGSVISIGTITISSAYATGSVSGGDGNDKVGGLLAELYVVAVSNSYSISAVNGDAGTDKVGRLAGTSALQGTITGSYYSSDSTLTVGASEPNEFVPPSGVTSLDDAGLKSLNTGLSTNDWDLTAGKYPSLKSYKEDASTQIAGDLLCGQLPVADFVQCTSP